MPTYLGPSADLSTHFAPYKKWENIWPHDCAGKTLATLTFDGKWKGAESPPVRR